MLMIMSIYYKDVLKNETEYKFKGFLINDSKDIFVKNALEKLGWLKENVKAYMYLDDTKLKLFHYNLKNYNDKIIIRVNKNNNNLERVKINSIEQATNEMVKPSDVDSLDYYTQEEINDWEFINTVLKDWNNINPDPDNNTTPPDYQNKVLPELKFRKTVQTAYSEDILDYIEAVELNVTNRINLEDLSISQGKTKLD